jgi:hypothetical protein
MRRAASHFWRAWLQAKAGAYDVWMWTKRAALALISFFARLDAVAIFTGILAIFTGILAIVAYLQWLTLEKTDQTLKLQQRAWIAPGRLIAPQNFIEQKDEAVAIGLTFQNVGKEPAIELNEQIKADIVETSRWRDDAFIEVKVREMLGKRCENFNTSPDGRAIFPGTPAAQYVDLEADKAIKASKDQTHFALMVGCFAYRTLNEVHRSRFCGVLAPPNRSNDFKWQTVLCAVHNGAD